MEERWTQIQKDARSGVLIAAHRGVAAGNVPCNSMAAFGAALRQGADIIELDVSRSADGVLYVFHPGMEPRFLCCGKWIPELTSGEIDRLRLVNQDGTPTQYGVPRLEDALLELRSRCHINLDKFWTCPKEIASLVRHLGMQDQTLIKTTEGEKNFRRVEEYAWDIPYMVVAKDQDDFTQVLLSRRMRYVGVEALFEREDAPIASREYLLGMNEQGLVTWVNSIVYDHRVVLSAHHDDDISVSQDEAMGWGWLIDRGFRIIQTDWTLALDQYLRRRALR